jgi:hypothetical protein
MLIVMESMNDYHLHLFGIDIRSYGFGYQSEKYMIPIQRFLSFSTLIFFFRAVLLLRHLDHAPA